jgi:hypothetical protein
VFSTIFVQIIVREAVAQHKEIVPFVEQPIYITRHFMPMMHKTRLHRRLHLHLILQHPPQNLHKTLRESGIIPVRKDAPEELEQPLLVLNAVERWHTMQLTIINIWLSKYLYKIMYILIHPGKYFILPG